MKNNNQTAEQNNQQTIIMKTTYQTFLDMLETELQKKAKGVHPAMHSVTSDIEGMTEGYPFLFPYYAMRAAAKVTIKDCINLLHLFYVGIVYERNLQTGYQLTDVLFGEGSTEEDMKNWLLKLSMIDENGTVSDFYINNGCAYISKNQVYLTEKGLDLVEAARDIYRTAGYKLVENVYSAQTLKTNE
jgi:hypothetical protein